MGSDATNGHAQKELCAQSIRSGHEKRHLWKIFAPEYLLMKTLSVSKKEEML